MAGDPNQAPENLFGISDPAELDRVAGRLAATRLARLEDDPPLTSFTRDDLVGVHSFLMRDIYPWAGEIRTTEVGAMGMAMCRAQFVDNELDRVIRDIGRKSPSTTDVDAAVNTVADHWSEMTMVHPFQDGNSRTQRFFSTRCFGMPGGRWIGPRLTLSRSMLAATSVRPRSTRRTSRRRYALRCTRLIRSLPVR